MMRRIWKELREMALYGSILMIGTFAWGLPIIHWYTSRFPQSYGNMEEIHNFAFRLHNTGSDYFVQWTGWYTAMEYILMLLIAVNMFGSEHRDGTLARLLSQPIARRRIILEKIAAYGVVMIAVISIHLAVASHFFFYLQGVIAEYLPKFRLSIAVPPASPWAAKTFIQWGLPAIAINLAAGVIALAHGLPASLFIRQTHTAFWAALVFPIGVAMLLLPFANVSINSLQIGLTIEGNIGFVLIVGFSCLWTMVMLTIAWLKFKRLEV
ncbi:MAG: ABC transporter permease [bacterium]|nr:ABC transporter permease [bacterium]